MIDESEANKRARFSDLSLAVRKAAGLLLSGKMFSEPGAVRRALKKARWLRLKHFGVAEVVLPFLGNMKLCVSTSDNIIACDVYLDGQFGYAEFQRAIALLREAGYLRADGNVFIDVGANIGTHSLYAWHSNLFGRVVSVEPERRNFERLIQNLSINGFDSSSARNVGLSDTNRASYIELSHDNFGDHRIVRAQPGQDGAATRPQVRLIDFATLAKDVALDFDRTGPLLFWIDTQGHEYEVLSGIDAKVLRTSAFVVEFWPPVLRANGTLESLLNLVSSVASAYVVLQQPSQIHRLDDLPQLSSELLAKRHPDDLVDLLFVGKDCAAALWSQ